MNTSHVRLVEELQALSLGLPTSSTLTLKHINGSMLCQFLSHGLANHVVTVTNQQLATALWQVSSSGIIDGSDFVVFKNVFSKFSLHVKTRLLYAELGVQQPDLDIELQNLLVA
ncbi:hypothetical protein Q4E40_05420 [Pontibacter sp. BT731]|uniref:hypothetical protein n=1 Tax=Pontibacter coccineus TaxID=3063328 RepID=UPI0026E2E6AD|nr:hypothetical protein [Pontibacter sp. BT731]MDO6389556.1 hypothetical protein [Pontibacter sp. BT731]